MHRIGRVRHQTSFQSSLPIPIEFLSRVSQTLQVSRRFFSESKGGDTLTFEELTSLMYGGVVEREIPLAEIEEFDSDKRLIYQSPPPNDLKKSRLEKDEGQDSLEECLVGLKCVAEMRHHQFEKWTFSNGSKEF